MSMSGLKSWWLGLSVLLLNQVTFSVSATSEYPDIGDELTDLVKWGNEGRALSLEEGDLLILDFFAHWCSPCLNVSQEMRSLEMEGALDGARVLAVNVEKNGIEHTNRFIERAGFEEVYFDAEGALVRSLKIESLPCVVVAQVTRGPTGQGVSVLRKFDTFPGGDALLSYIAGLRPLGADSSVRSTLLDEDDRFKMENTNGGVRWVGSAVTAESLLGEGIGIKNYNTNFVFGGDAWEGALSFASNESELTYFPSTKDLVGWSHDRSEMSRRVSLSIEREINSTLSALYTASYYKGYTDYRSVWLDEFYRQQFEPVEGYQFADPKGLSGSIGGRFEYIPATASLDVVAGYQYDEIAPAYEAVPFEPLVRGESEIETYFVSLTSENLVTPRVKLRQQVRFSDTTNRSLRTSYSVRGHFALSDAWVLKTDLGRTDEASDFDSNHVGMVLEKDLADGFILGVLGRRYSDSGEIADPNILSTAAPELSTDLYGVNLSWAREGVEFGVQWSRYHTRYGDLPDVSFQFERLYEDRNWNALKCSGSYSF